MLIRARVRATAIGIGFLLVCGCAQRAADSISNSSTLSNSATSEKNSVRVYIDPKTGELRDPTPEELAAEAAADAQKKKAAAANQQSEQPASRETVKPNGAVEVTLDPSAQHPFRACIDKQGDLKMEQECEGAPGEKR